MNQYWIVNLQTGWGANYLAASPRVALARAVKDLSPKRLSAGVEEIIRLAVKNRGKVVKVCHLRWVDMPGQRPSADGNMVQILRQEDRQYLLTNDPQVHDFDIFNKNLRYQSREVSEGGSSCRVYQCERCVGENHHQEEQG